MTAHTSIDLAASQASASRRPLKVALFGFGTVGASVARILAERTELGGRIQLTHVFNRDVARKRVDWVPESVSWTQSVEDALASRPDVVVEVMGGVQDAYTIVRRALEQGASVVTANKMLLAAHGPELLRLAGDTWRADPVRSGGRRRCPADPRRARGTFGRHADGCRRNPERDVQLHPEPHVRHGRSDGRRPEGCAEARICRGRPDGRRRRVRCRRQAGGAGRNRLPPAHADWTTSRRAPSGPFRAPTSAMRGGLAAPSGRSRRCTSTQDTSTRRLGPALVPGGSSFGRNLGANNVVTIYGKYGGESAFSGAGAGGPATAVAVVSDLLGADPAFGTGSRGSGSRFGLGEPPAASVLPAIRRSGSAGHPGGYCHRPGRRARQSRRGAAGTGLSEGCAAVRDYRRAV